MKESDFIQTLIDHKNMIYQICWTYSRVEEDRKDLEQEIIYQLWRSFKRFDGRVKISTWIYRVALNTAISFIRKETKVQRIHFSDEYLLEYNHPEDDKSAELEILKEIIDELPPFDKALMLLFLEEHSYREIGEILGMSETNVGSRISRIRKTLKAAFEKKN